VFQPPEQGGSESSSGYSLHPGFHGSRKEQRK
jgi:hypothetical protein